LNAFSLYCFPSEHNIIRSVAYAGTNRRLRRFLDKVHSGERFTVAVIGGSVSGGHGLQTADNYYDDTNMWVRYLAISVRSDEETSRWVPADRHKRIFNYFVSLSPRAENDHVFVNGAQGGQGTPYFRCVPFDGWKGRVLDEYIS
jgi:hypothetical protein